MPRIYARAIRPRKPFPNRRAADKILREAANEVADISVEYLEQYTASWEHKPEWGKRVKITRTEIIIYIFPKGENAQIFKWVSGGTKGPYPIPKSGTTLLAFKTDYQPKTQPGGRYRGPGKAVGPGIVRMHVTHPGIKPREIEKTIGQWLRNRKDVQKIMKNAMARAKRAIALN